LQLLLLLLLLPNVPPALLLPLLLWRSKRGLHNRHQQRLLQLTRAAAILGYNAPQLRRTLLLLLLLRCYRFYLAATAVPAAIASWDVDNNIAAAAKRYSHRACCSLFIA
jgi:hypothetical protein